MSIDKLAKINSHERDARITFDPVPHKYYVDGKGGYTSVTTFVHESFPKFNDTGNARRMALCPDFESKYPQYADLIKQFPDRDDLAAAIIRKWNTDRDLAASLGTAMHAGIEMFYNDVEAQDLPEYFITYAKRRKDDGYVPFRTEWQIYDEESGIAGSIDMIYYRPSTGTYHMVDWKRSKRIDKRGFGNGLVPMQHLRDCNYMHYSLQLNTYKYILEKHYGIKIEDMHICVLHPDNQMELEIYDMQKDVYILMQRAIGNKSSTKDLRPETVDLATSKSMDSKPDTVDLATSK